MTLLKMPMYKYHGVYRTPRQNDETEVEFVWFTDMQQVPVQHPTGPVLVTGWPLVLDEHRRFVLVALTPRFFRLLHTVSGITIVDVVAPSMLDTHIPAIIETLGNSSSSGYAAYHNTTYYDYKRFVARGGKKANWVSPLAVLVRRLSRIQGVVPPALTKGSKYKFGYKRVVHVNKFAGDIHNSIEIGASAKDAKITGEGV